MATDGNVSADRTQSSADIAFMEAIEAGIAERNIYPDGATFIDAEHPSASKAIANAAGEGRVVVLCSQDGTRQILHPFKPAAT